MTTLCRLLDIQVIIPALQAAKSVFISKPILPSHQMQEKLLNAVFHFLLSAFNVKVLTP